MPTRRLPDDPNLDHLRNQAKTLLKQVRAGDAQALALVTEFFPSERPATAPVDPEHLGSPSADALRGLADAQLVIARSYGFPSWPQLNRHLGIVERYTRSPHRETTGNPVETPAQRADEFLRLATLHYGQDDPQRPDAARSLLTSDPEVAQSNFFTQVVAGDIASVRGQLAQHPHLANRQGGPFDWEPLLYLTYSRLPVAPEAPLEIARLLLEHGADPNAGFLWAGMPSPFTALTGAFGRGEGNQPPHQNRLALARLLLEAGADPNDSQTMYNCGPGCPPPHDADHLRLLLEFGLGQGDGGPWHQRLTVAHPTPRQLLEDELVFASSEGLLDRVQLMLDAGTDPEGRGTEHPVFCGHRAFELASVQGHAEIATLLRAAGAPPLDDIHELFAAVLNGSTAPVDPALAARAIQRNPYLPIRAAELGRTEALQPLKDLGWNLNILAMATPLHQAAWHGHLATARKLIELGADPTLRDPNYNGTPLNWAMHSHQQEVVDYLTGLDLRADSEEQEGAEDH
ncbi:ankyrin repeat domain-containing protein [Kribbella sp. NPDC051770]|uniref:ankyrin repeat domain-containing protein n=1 Tax=Kribbella sp. NPDC051770 TaxID=3155413 RepID=UPI003421874F